MKADSLKSGKYILAISGGVDSVVLLDIFSRQSGIDIVVAHFDHGIRPNSAIDRKFVQNLAKKHKLKFEYKDGKLGPDASEAKARAARYKFLRGIKKKHKAKAIITAHHQDDVIETAIINIIRGTNRKGLSSLGSTKDIVRPLVFMTKTQIKSYAKRKNLKWRDDLSNKDTSYLRNYVRLVLISKLNKKDPLWQQEFLKRIATSKKLNIDITGEIEKSVSTKLKVSNKSVIIPRTWLIMLPNNVGREALLVAIEKLGVDFNRNKKMINRALLFCKTAGRGKIMEISKTVEIKIEKANVLVNAKT